MKIAPKNPSTIYILSSKFHRFFLKNLKPTEVNTRIIRIDGILLPHPKVSELNANHFGSVYNDKHTNVYKNPGQSKPSVSYVQNYFEAVGKRHQYESVRVTNKTVSNPFSSSHTAKRSDPMAHQRVNVPKVRFSRSENYYNAN